MVYVFGLDLPIMEMLFVYELIILFAMVALLIEVAKLKRMMLIEKSDIFKFTKSLDDVKKYVESSMLQGYSTTDVKRMLYDKGWSKKTVEAILADLKNQKKSR